MNPNRDLITVCTIIDTSVNRAVICQVLVGCIYTVSKLGMSEGGKQTMKIVQTNENHVVINLNWMIQSCPEKFSNFAYIATEIMGPGVIVKKEDTVNQYLVPFKPLGLYNFGEEFRCVHNIHCSLFN